MRMHKRVVDLVRTLDVVKQITIECLLEIEVTQRNVVASILSFSEGQKCN